MTLTVEQRAELEALGPAVRFKLLQGSSEAMKEDTASDAKTTWELFERMFERFKKEFRLEYEITKNPL